MAHPYRCGFASHLGLAIGKPTIGVAKSRLVGNPITIGNDVFLVENGQVIGSVVTTEENSKPVYVSIGHLVSLEKAIKIVRHCAVNQRIPEPLLQAHKIASEERKSQKI
jgi:deoxyribonuclease V